VTQPQQVHVETVGEPDPDAVADIAQDCFDDWSGVTERLIEGEYELY
jgi:hypothetical protein